MLTSKQKNWCTVYSRAKAEKKVYEQLECSGYELYLPSVTTIKEWSHSKQKINTPLLSSYIFIKNQEEKLNHVLSAYRATRTLKHLGKNAIVKNQEIEKLKRSLNTNFSIQLSDRDRLNNGDEFEVVNGSSRRLKAIDVKDKNKHNNFC